MNNLEENYKHHSDNGSDPEIQIETVKDFDFGVGNDPEDYDRVSVLPVGRFKSPVSSPEIGLILWLLLEKTFGKLRQSLYPEESSYDSDETDSRNSLLEHQNENSNFGRRRRVDSNNTDDGLGDSKPINQTGDEPQSPISQVEQYTRNLLEYMGINVPFNHLSEDEKTNLFEQFSASSELLATEKYTSVLQLYEALCRRSKFRENFEEDSKIGKGKYGEVFAVRRKSGENHNTAIHNKNDRNVFAIKKINLTLEIKIEDIQMILNEAAILKKLSGHPRIAQIHNSWLAMDSEDESSNKNDSLVFYLQMNLYGKSLKDWKRTLKGNQIPIPLDLSVRIGKQILEGVEWIHKQNILHLDLNPANILWSNQDCKEVVIGDFGLAVQGLSSKGRRGTPPYCAPEVMMTSKSDVFSIGVTIFELTREFSTLSELVSVLGSRNFVTGVTELDNIISQMTTPKPADRPNASQILKQLENQNWALD